VRKLAREHLRLVHQIERLGLAQELGTDALDAMLEAVANGGEASFPVPQILTVRRAAVAAGAPGQMATDSDAPPARQPTPSEDAESEEEPTMVFSVHFDRPHTVLVPTSPLTAFVSPSYSQDREGWRRLRT